jgi:hypothetical protein
MPNPIKGETPLILDDGRAFTLVLDHEALVLAADAYGYGFAALLAHAMPPEDADGNIIGQPKYAAIRALLFGALSWRHPEITLREASAITLQNFDAVYEALGSAGQRSFPKQGEAEGEQSSRPPKGKKSTGKRSGGNGAKSASNRKRSGEQPRAPTK